MNGKKAKDIRKFLRSIGHNVNQRYYSEGEAPVFARFSHNDEGELVADDMGIHILKVRKGVPFKLAPDCGRAVYQEMKRRV